MENIPTTSRKASTESISSNRFAAILAVIVAASLLGSAVLAPAVATILQKLLNAPDLPFSRIFDRTAILILLIMATIFRKDLGLGRIREYWRAEKWSERGRMVALGVTASLAPALAVLVPAIESSQLLWAGKTMLQGAVKIAEGIPSALFVGLVEECFFRLVIFRGLAVTWKWPIAAVTASAFYSVVHFLVPEKGFVLESASPVHGLTYLGAAFSRIIDPVVLPAVFGLFLIGLTLCIAIQRRGSLFLAVGLHAGWFLAAKAAIRLSALPPELAAGESMVKRQLLIGNHWLWLAIVVTAAVVFVTTRGRQSSA